MLNILLIGISGQDQKKIEKSLQKNFQLQVNYVKWDEKNIDLVITGSMFISSEELRNKIKHLKDKTLTLSANLEEAEFSKIYHFSTLFKNNYTDKEFIQWLSPINLELFSHPIEKAEEIEQIFTETVREQPNDLESHNVTCNSFLQFFFNIFKNNNNFYINNNYCEIRYETMSIVSHALKPDYIESFSETEKQIHIIQEYQYSIVDFLYSVLINNVDDINYEAFLNFNNHYKLKFWPPFIHTTNMRHLNLFLEIASLLQKKSLNTFQLIEVINITPQEEGLIKLFLMCLEKLDYLEKSDDFHMNINKKTLIDKTALNEIKEYFKC